jgi:RNA polymerase sigma-32 factor
MGYIDTPETLRANRRFMKAAMKVPLLSEQREAELARRWRYAGDEIALRDLVTPYMRLVISTASRFRSYGLPLGDLVQEGNVGLMQAAARFDPERNVRFSTYATWWIRSSIQEFVLRNWSIVRTGTTAAQKSLFFNLRRLKARIARGTAGTGFLDADGKNLVARRLGVSVRDVDQMEGRLSGADKSLNAPIGEDGDSEWQDLLPEDRPNPEDIAIESSETAARSRWIETAMNDLTPREQIIIRERRLAEDGLTLDALGKRLGVSKERVRQIEQEALMKLRLGIERQVTDPVAAGLVDG